VQDVSVLDFFSGPGTRLFTIAGFILVGLLVIEIVSLVMGVSLSAKIDAMLDLDAPEVPDAADHGGIASSGLDAPGAEPGIFGTAWDWLNAGRVPVVVVIMALLGAFSAIGLAIQAIAHLVIGFLPAFLAAIPAFLLALPLTRGLSRGIGKIVPRDESYAVDRDDLIGLTGIVTLGPVTATEIGRVTLKDGHGNKHFPWVRGATTEVNVATGGIVLLTERHGNEYLVIPADPKLVA
jgi:hypothetical protein